MELFLIAYLTLVGLLILQMDPIKYLIVKVILSTLYLALAFIITKPISPPNLLHLGLGFCFIGDVVLGIYHLRKQKLIFLLGLGAFFSAHLIFGLYLTRLVDLNGFSIVAALLTVGVIRLIKRIKLIDYQGLDLAIISYGVVISVMSSLAVFNYLQSQTPASLLLMVGSILFFISDLFIIFKYFYHKKYFFVKLANLSTYYLAVLLIGLSLRG